MKKYRKKPIIIEAIQFTDENKNIAFSCIGCNANASFDESNKPIIKIETLEGEMTARLGDWIIKGVNGEFYPIKPDIFEKTYELVNN